MVERRLTPRAPVSLACTLRRGHGSPIDARTLDVGPAGMCITCKRPLRTDEVVAFELADEHVGGEARVLREQGFGEYALRFEQVDAPGRARLDAMTSASS
jgi:hypothetical protein